MDRSYKDDRTLSRFGEEWTRDAKRARPPAWVGWSMWAVLLAFTVLISVVTLLSSST